MNNMSKENLVRCTKPIWIVTFKSDYQLGGRVERVGAYNMLELLSYYNEQGINSIIKVKKTEDEITYHYPNSTP